jgi:hypothetical protein
MYVHLYSIDQPAGRCLDLAQNLHHVSGLSPTESVQLAERLFASQHKRDNPAAIEVREPALFDSLSRTCTEFGIAVEVAPDWS